MDEDQNWLTKRRTLTIQAVKMNKTLLMDKKKAYLRMMRLKKSTPNLKWWITNLINNKLIQAICSINNIINKAGHSSNKTKQETEYLICNNNLEVAINNLHHRDHNKGISKLIGKVGIQQINSHIHIQIWMVEQRYRMNNNRISNSFKEGCMEMEEQHTQACHQDKVDRIRMLMDSFSIFLVSWAMSRTCWTIFRQINQAFK